MSEMLLPGFADPVADAQASFRAVLAAMSRPGMVHKLPDLAAPSPLCPAAAALLLTLVDAETKLGLDEAAGAASGWIAFHTGAPLVAMDAAQFVLALSLPALEMLASGSHAEPENSATVIVQVASLSAGARFLLQGPGLREPAAFAVQGMPADFAAIWQRNHAQFPRGVDLILCAGTEIAALPRSLSITDL